MGIYAKLFSKIPDLDENQIQNYHQEVLDCFYKIKELIPRGYSSLNLIDIALIKSYGYHTGFDQLYYRYSRLKNVLTKSKLFNKKLSSNISYKLIINHGLSYNEIYSELKSETPYIIGDAKLPRNLNSDNGYNLFFSNTQTYLLVLIEYMIRSSHDNHILIIPKYLNKCDVLKKLDKSKVIFFEDFIDNSIIKEYEKSKNIFSKIYKDNSGLLYDYFTINGKEYFPFLETGLNNIFNYVFPEVVLNTFTIKNIFQNIPTSNLIGGRVRKLYDRSFLELGSQNNIKTYILFHSNLLRNTKGMHATGHFNNIHGIFAWGENQKQLIEADKFSNVNKIFITGSPLFEKTTDISIYNIKQRESIIYACGSRDLKEAKIFIESMAPIQNKNKIIVKVHPHIEDAGYKRLARGYQVEIIKGETVFEDLLDNAKIVITLLSEASLHSIIRRIPTLFIFIEKKWDKVLHDLYDINDYEKDRLIIRNKKQLLPIVNNIIESDEFRKSHIQVQDDFVKRNIKIHDGVFGTTKEIDRILC